MDQLDFEIIKALMQDGSCTNVSLGERLDTPVSTIRLRIKKLQEKGIFQIVGVANPQKIGFTVHAIMGVKVDYAKLSDVGVLFANIGNVRYVAYTSGAYNLVVMAFFQSMKDYGSFIREKVSQISGILDIQTMHVVEEIKRNYNYYEFMENIND